ncbi:hypothetical protein H8E88_29860 [candidate division KSB1 bacterium]|nr:hypothetical protein [candidate division KSB1 bacterium]
MQEYYEQFFHQFKRDKYLRYLKYLQPALGKKYKFASTPIFISTAQYDRLTAVTGRIVRLLQDELYQKSVYDITWFLPQYPMQKHDYFGCVDFHIQPDSERIIETNLFAPGFSSFMELIETHFFEIFGYFGEQVSPGFEKELVKAVTKNFEKKQVAIVDIDAYNQYNFDEFKYIKKLLANYDVESCVAPAENVGISETGNLLFEGKEFNRIYNRLITYDWEQHADNVKNYSELFKNNPDMFFTNPFGWKLGDKRILPVLSNLNKQPFGLTKKDVEILSKTVLKTKLLNEFSNLEECVEEFGLPRRVILKPLDNYAGRGILFKPSNKKLKEIIEKEKEKFIIQEIFPAGKIPYIMPDGNITEAKFDVRIVFMNAEVVGAYGRSYQGSITNFSGDVGGIAPVVVV